MEPFATKMLLSRFIKKCIGIRVLTTDRSSLIKRLMRDVNTELKKRGKPSIKHCYDVWHMVKAITKDLFVASKLKQCQTLGSWIKSVRNMLWHSFASCKVGNY
jgi:solute carrier family 8 (sodium/calcium exchanger)